MTFHTTFLSSWKLLPSFGMEPYSKTVLSTFEHSIEHSISRTDLKHLEKLLRLTEAVKVLSSTHLETSLNSNKRPEEVQSGQVIS